MYYYLLFVALLVIIKIFFGHESMPWFWVLFPGWVGFAFQFMRSLINLGNLAKMSRDN